MTGLDEDIAGDRSPKKLLKVIKEKHNLVFSVVALLHDERFNL